MVLKQYIFVRIGTSLLYLSVVNVAFYCENVLPYTVYGNSRLNKVSVIKGQ